MFNKVVLVGNLTRDIELSYASNGNAIGNTAIAATRKFNVNGEKREETCFIDVTFFGKMAEVANQYLSKGSKLLVEGRLKFDQWTDNNGQNRSKHSIVVENMEMLGSPQNQNNSGNQGGYQQQNYGQQQGGYAQQQGYAQPQQGYAQPQQRQAAPQQQQRAATSAQQRQAIAPQQAGYAQQPQQGYAQPAQQQGATSAPQQQQYAAPQAEAAYQQQYQTQEYPEIDINEDMQGNEEIPF